MDKLLFGISGIPLGKGEKFDYCSGIEYLNFLGLDAMELPFVRSVNVTAKNKDKILNMKNKTGMYLSAHGSYYINLNSKEEEKIEKSKERIIKGSEALESVGGRSLVFHAGYYLDSSKEETLDKIKAQLNDLPAGNVCYRLETTGKATQFGDLIELTNIAKEIPNCNLCIDFSHIHAREGGSLKNYSDFARILDYIGDNLGEMAIKDMHIHISGINYTSKGERNHLPLLESDFKYKECIKALADFNVKGCVICESPILENDALLLKETYFNS